ncbi:cytidine deaminase [Neodiprion pinetum]|uniref:cytidine deaminase n=1 Tax=Neodiprion pinetum TaxID=441929 RepID=UPI001EDE1B92|nr:cytidine deaminase-like [Neodiprion pinetum]XP_046488411.1 cytidine deaminase-like [Neodiprion pinetum]XP_046488420.1 cytidine deaminase-like [Neodiprion pinetum]XP_046488430.1 cytidine deaminase-like [Neodiprion pinetum]XP_046488432.1 cytidine deaminase-like [Neodiprion pinetum]
MSGAGKVVEFDSLAGDIQELIKAGVDARTYSYSPYSKFKVGAALRCEDGTICKGCNVENTAYPVSICAERTAISKAVSDGKRKFVALAVIADLDDTFVSPCGECRQFIIEFGDIPIYLAKTSLGTVFETSAANMLPLAFTILNNSEK